MVVGPERRGHAGRDERDGRKGAGGGVVPELIQRSNVRPHPLAPEGCHGDVDEVLTSLDACPGEAVEDVLGAVRADVEGFGAGREAFGLGGVDVLAVRPRGAQQRGMVAVHHREPARHARLHGDVLAEVVAGGEAIVAGAGAEEAVVALLPARAPTVSGVVVHAPAEGVGLVAELADVRRPDVGPRHVAVVHVDRAVDREVLAVEAAAVVHVLLIGGEVTEVVVERPVLHREHEDRVDRALRRGRVQDAVGRYVRSAERGRARRSTRGVSEPEDAGATDGRRASHEAGSPEKFASVHPAPLVAEESLFVQVTGMRAVRPIRGAGRRLVVARTPARRSTRPRGRGRSRRTTPRLRR